MSAAVTRTVALRNADASVRQRAEYRSPEEVFAPESLASLRAAAVTDRRGARVQPRGATRRSVMDGAA